MAEPRFHTPNNKQCDQQWIVELSEQPQQRGRSTSLLQLVGAIALQTPLRLRLIKASGDVAAQCAQNLCSALGIGLGRCQIHYVNPAFMRLCAVLMEIEKGTHSKRSAVPLRCVRSDPGCSGHQQWPRDREAR